MDQTPLVMDEIEAGNDFLSRLNTFEHVVAACWLRDAETGETCLYVAFDGLTEESDKYGNG